MDFDQLEKNVRLLISKNKLDKTLELNDAFNDSSDSDDITIQSGNYYSILEKQPQGTAETEDVERLLSDFKI